MGEFPGVLAGQHGVAVGCGDEAGGGEALLKQGAEAAALLQQRIKMGRATGRFQHRGGGAGEERSFGDIRDLDDITAEVFEVLTRTGKYYWVEMSRVEVIEFMPPERPLDLVWRPARMVVKDAFDAQVHLPAVYGTLHGADDAARLGRRTEWVGEEGHAVVGVGRRSFVLDGEEEVDMMAIDRLSFTPA